MPQPRFRIPWGKKFELPGIPIREKPGFVRPPQYVHPNDVRSPSFHPVTHRPPLPDRPGSGAKPGIEIMRAPAAVQREMDNSPALRIRPVTYRPPLPLRPTGSGSQPVLMPPAPIDYTPDISLAEIGPVGRPAHISLSEIGPVGPEPDLPDWLIEEARLKAPDIRFAAMPRDIVMEGRHGVNVKPQPSDYRAPPVTTPREIISMRDVSPAPSEEFILEQIKGDYRPTERPTGMPDRELELRDFNLDLLKGTSRYAAGIGQTQGRTLGEGI